MRLRHDPARVVPVTDAAQFGRVAVLYGGGSAEREVSLQSGAAVLDALRRRSVDAHGFDPAERSLADLPALFDRAFIALHGPGGEDGTVQGALECLGVPYTGSGVLGSALGMDKLRTKRIAQAIGIPTADYVILRNAGDLQTALERIGLPLVIKPAAQGSSVGITRVTHVNQLEAAYQAAAEIDDGVLAERWLPGAEFTVAILRGAALPPIRIETATEFYDYEAKYLRSDTRHLVPSGLSGQAEAHVRELALATFDAVGAEGWGRVDLRSDATGRPHLLEINTVPGMTGHSLVPMAAKAAGIDFDALCWRVLESAQARVRVEDL